MQKERFWQIVAQTEWPTLGMLVACYAAFGLSTTWLASLWLPLGCVATALVIALFSSLQHEILHGHPFSDRRLNEALVFPGLTLFVPFQRFRDLHLAHHHDEILTDPYDDPEANYLDPAVWNRLSSVARAVLRVNNTLAGRILIGPAIAIGSLCLADWRAIRAGDSSVGRAWLLHGLGVCLVLGWLLAFSAMPVWVFVVAAYLGYGVLKIRTFLEHRAHERASGRTVVVEDRGLLALLFLNNNFHVVHHMHPFAPWYDLPGLYARNRERYLTRNGGYRYASYGEVFALYFLKAKDPVPHPLWPQQ